MGHGNISYSKSIKILIYNRYIQYYVKYCYCTHVFPSPNFITYLYLRYQQHLLWHNEPIGLQLTDIDNCIYAVVCVCWQNKALLGFKQSNLHMTAFDTTHSPKMSIVCLCLAAFGLHTTLLVLPIMIIICFPLIPFLHTPLCWSSYVWSLNQPRQSRRTEENRLEKGEGLRGQFCSASCITGELPAPAWWCLNGCEALLRIR